ncbi:helix-turn-helix domain-containing protein [Burkholderia vietnamiensis]|uniref:helix-turn-helix domain-containing protein n=1 Tax=Burkholderia vietnamiensis TaxID=60552 RepID=UPI001B939848|nr:helix-turn-helix transcriptional regulator [Burkholderia vietnamiensis]MBR8151648.1 helix-turn-helix transcriptional regulator [Burkholderia vietnamiensis]MBR8217355.1 helix-turn-helix transcriptional regulator [Burkholderia vietnamiensis]
MKPTKLAKLRSKAYRNAYVKAHLTQGLAFQIREMRLARGLTQSQLASHLGIKGQSAVARLEDPSYGKMSLATLLKVAAFFDVAFLGKMVPYTKFLAETRDVSPRAMVVESFEEEDAAGALENAPEFTLLRRVTAASSASTTIAVLGQQFLHPLDSPSQEAYRIYDGTKDSRFTINFKIPGTKEYAAQD